VRDRVSKSPLTPLFQRGGLEPPPFSKGGQGGFLPSGLEPYVSSLKAHWYENVVLLNSHTNVTTGLPKSTGTLPPGVTPIINSNSLLFWQPEGHTVRISSGCSFNCEAILLTTDSLLVLPLRSGGWVRRHGESVLRANGAGPRGGHIALRGAATEKRFPRITLRNPNPSRAGEDKGFGLG